MIRWPRWYEGQIGNLVRTPRLTSHSKDGPLHRAMSPITALVQWEIYFFRPEKGVPPTGPPTPLPAASGLPFMGPTRNNPAQLLASSGMQGGTHIPRSVICHLMSNADTLIHNFLHLLSTCANGHYGHQGDAEIYGINCDVSPLTEATMLASSRSTGHGVQRSLKNNANTILDEMVKKKTTVESAC